MLTSFDPIDIFIFLSGIALLLKKVAEMDRYHSLRVLLLTTFLSTIVISLFLYFVLVYSFSLDQTCMVPCGDDYF